MRAILLALALCLPVAVNAQTQDVRTLTDVKFAAAAEALEFTFVADGPLTADRLQTTAEGEVIIFGVAGAKTERRWLAFADAAINRTFLHPSPDGKSAKLRVRLKAPVDRSVVANVKVRVTDGRLVASMPRTAAIAAQWAAPAAVVAVAAAPVEAPAAPVEAAPVADAPAVAETAPAAEAPAVADAPAVEDEAPVAAAAAAPAEAPAAAEAAQPLVLAANDVAVTPAVESLTLATDAARPLAGEPEAPTGPSLGAVAAALLLLAGTAWYLLRKAKAMRKGAAGPQKLIRTVGSHFLGPKHALLLVEVAGELVLLSTNEKGVQLLTKIDPAHAADAARRLAEEVPAAIASGAPATTLADRFGRMFSRAWGAGSDEVSGDAVERGFFERADAAVREAGEDDALAALAGDTTDDVRLAAPMPRVGRTPVVRQARPPVRPAPAPAPASSLRGEGGEPLTSDILEKIRQLQSA